MDEMFSELIGAFRFAGVEPKEIERLHFSNYAVDMVFRGDAHEGVFQLHGMYEDSDIDGNEQASEMADLIEAVFPGQFVLIDTGDYIRNELEVWGDHKLECYDPNYCLYLIHRSTFDAQREKLGQVDSTWRTCMQRRANGEQVDPAVLGWSAF